MNLVFGVKLTGADRVLVVLLHDYFGVGKIYRVKARGPRAGAGWTKRASYYRVTKNADLLEIIKHFDGYPLLGSKRQGYEIWREMVHLKNAHFRNPPIDRLNELAARLTATKPAKQPWSAGESTRGYGSS
jgi:hypothetical protein